MTQKVINDGSSLRSFIRCVLDEKLREAINGAPQVMSEEDDLTSALQSDTGDQKKQVKPDQQPGGENVPEEIDVKAIIEKLNSIRSGRSFRDSAVEQKMDAFFNNLEDAEKKALFQFLSGLAQVVTGEVPTETVIKSGDPGNPPASVDMKLKDDNRKEKASLSLKPNIVANKPSAKKDANAEDTTSPAPINPKKR